jgi:hypothetical protein
MVDLTDGYGLVAVIFEVLGQRCDSWHGLANGRIVAVYSAGVGSDAAKKAGPGRSADGLLAIRSLEEQPPPGQAVDIWRDNVFDSIAAQLRAQVVYGDEEDVSCRVPRTFSFCVLCAAC